MKKTITILSMLLVFTAFSQTAIKKSSIDSGGASVTNGSVSMVYTIGEVAVQENTSGTTYISEGFISKDMMSSLGLNSYTQLSGISMYPNPATDFVNVSFATTANYTVIIYNLLGKELVKYQVANQNTQRIALNKLPNAVYLVLVKSDANKQFTTYKLIKE